MSDTVYMTCGKKDRCKHKDNCPYKYRPLPSYLCFDRGKIRKENKKDENKNN